MQAFVDDLERSGEPHSPKKYEDFRKTLAEVERHPNRTYFILKSIIVHNLYGVDLMEEAVEICKLRLFLKLVSQVGAVKDLEPLPDVDFNIRAGNALIGFVSREEIWDQLKREANSGQGKIVFAETEAALTEIDEQAEVVARWFGKYRQMQVADTQEDLDSSGTKTELRRRLDQLQERLNAYLVGRYGAPNIAAWSRTHKPFHWFSEFYRIVDGGGFDVVLGNPPYVEYRGVSYVVLDMETLPCGDLYAFVTERAYRLLGDGGRFGFIVPISMFGVDGFATLQDATLRCLDPAWISFFANRPAQLFEGAQKRLTTALGKRSRTGGSKIHSSRYYRWWRQERDHVMSAALSYAERPVSRSVFQTSLEKLGGLAELSAFEKLAARDLSMGNGLDPHGRDRVFYTRSFQYFLVFSDRPPLVVDRRTRAKRMPSELKILGFSRRDEMLSAIAALASSTFFWFFNVLSDCRNVNRREIAAFPLNPRALSEGERTTLASLGEAYLEALYATSRVMVKSGLEIESFDGSKCKKQLDAVDEWLARYYGFTDEELDFIVNYDIKYRMGADEGEQD